ncbi:MAG TPA: hypothetical protein PKW90_24640, partial [Myxococcota bacterium]|nr:hypothetical protein [Myxococcota bacterium]
IDPMPRLLCLLPLFALSACTGTSTDSDSAPAESEAEPLPDTTYTPFFTDLATGRAIPDTPVTVNGEAYTTDAEGKFSLSETPGTALEMHLEVENYPAYRSYVNQPGVDLHQGFDIPSNATLSQLSRVLGITLDPNKAILVIGIFDEFVSEDEVRSVEGVTVTVDVGYDEVLVRDSNSTIGYSQGNTTLPGSVANVVFVNVDAGLVTPSFSLSNGRSCELGWSAVEAPAGGFSISTYQCEVP